MPNKRPSELNTYLDAATKKNDELIIEALGKLEDPSKRGKLKITVASVCQLTGLSRNTVRNRQWALDRLRELKQKHKADQQGAVLVGAEGTDDGAILDGLRRRVKCVLEQNVLLYEEILSLKRKIQENEEEMERLNARKLAPVTPLPRRVDILRPDSKT